MQRGQPPIDISSKSMEKIQAYILPYICHSMSYQLFITKEFWGGKLEGTPKVRIKS